MGYPELGHIPGPEWLEMVRQADLSSAVHFRRLSVQLGDGNLWCCGRVCHGDLEEWTMLLIIHLEEILRGSYIECHVELVFQEIVHVPALAEPLGALLVRLQPEPVHVRGLVVLYILREGRWEED